MPIRITPPPTIPVPKYVACMLPPQAQTESGSNSNLTHQEQGFDLAYLSANTEYTYLNYSFTLEEDGIVLVIFAIRLTATGTGIGAKSGTIKVYFDDVLYKSFDFSNIYGTKAIVCGKFLEKGSHNVKVTVTPSWSAYFWTRLYTLYFIGRGRTPSETIEKIVEDIPALDTGWATYSSDAYTADFPSITIDDDGKVIAVAICTTTGTLSITQNGVEVASHAITSNFLTTRFVVAVLDVSKGDVISASCSTTFYNPLLYVTPVIRIFE